jgi:predicted flap endonuclease-1-like 5' DNA nuclease
VGASNREIAQKLDRVADLLESLEANPFRVGSYRAAARELRSLSRPASALYAEGGAQRLQEISGVGRALSSSIAEIVETGELRLLDRLEADRSPMEAFARLPGVGEALAHRIHDELGVTTLEELEIAAHDGRLRAVEGIGDKRARGIRDALAVRLGRLRQPNELEHAEVESRPSVGLLLDVDREYRARARAGELRRISPRRFNPANEAWLPIMETERDGWQLKALFSNTQRAHELGRTRDWVVIYYHRDGDHGQATVVTSRAGQLRELRVVRGREPECRRHYAEVRKIA